MCGLGLGLEAQTIGNDHDRAIPSHLCGLFRSGRPGVWHSSSHLPNHLSKASSYSQVLVLQMTQQIRLL